jgi:hypothetical protein
MTHADIERQIRQRNEDAQRQAHFYHIKAQLWRRISEALRNSTHLTEGLLSDCSSSRVKSKP